MRTKYEMRKGLFLKHEYIDFQISQDSVATNLRWGGSIYNSCVEKFLQNLTVKEYCENRCSFAEVMTKKQSGCFFWNTVYGSRGKAPVGVPGTKSPEASGLQQMYSERKQNNILST